MAKKGFFGKYEAVVFLPVLGYNKDNAGWLIRQVSDGSMKYILNVMSSR